MGGSAPPALLGSWGLSPERFRPAKTFLDPVHGDISVLAIETDIIDTRAFQRLRRIKQLGTADMVFHGAKHDRFGHSLGTMWVADQMVAHINARVALKGEGVEIPDRARRLIRLAALLHDLGHAPYGHQLEDDFGVLPKHDRADRYTELLGADTEIGEILGPALRESLVQVLSAKTDAQIDGLEYPYAADIVGNTVCADLLDYSRRDVHYTGLDKRSGWRMLKYLFIPTSGDSARRVVIDAWKNDRVRSDVISDVLDLLDVRFSLAERVIFHHVKVSTGAMLARAVHDSALSDRDIVDLTDDELLSELQRDPSDVTQTLASALARRAVHGTVWISTESAPAATQESLTRYFTQPEAEGNSPFGKKCAFEDRITETLGLPRGSVLASCSKGVPLFKQADSRIRIGGSINKLRDVTTDPPSGAIEELKRRHSSLWRFYVFLSPGFIDEWAEVVVDQVQLALDRIVPGARNEIARLQPKAGAAILDRFAVLTEQAGAKPLTQQERGQLLELAARNEPGASTIFDTLKIRLDALRAPEQSNLELS